VASHHLASGALIQVLPTWRGPVMPLHLVSPTARQRTARVQAFMEWARTLLVKRFPVGAAARHGD
jgi:LysR family transcriptional regulator for bpeEF and oprC